MTTMRNGYPLTEPVVTVHGGDLVGDMFVALVALLATVDKTLRPLADQLVADPDTDPARVLWFAAGYASRVYPARIISSDAVRRAILAELDKLHDAMTLADHLTHWRTP